MPFRQTLAPLVVLMFLGACSSIPPSTQLRAALSPLEAKPSEIRVALVAPDKLVLRPGGAVMSVGWQPAAGQMRKMDFVLEILDGNAGAPLLLSRLQTGQRLYVLRLTDKDVVALLGLQREMQAAKASGVHGRGEVRAGLRDACWEGVFPSSPGPQPLEIHIRTEAGGDWMPLMAGVDLKDLLQAAGIQALPSCESLSPRG